MKKIIKLTENDLVRIVKRVIKEQMDAPTGLNVVMNPNVQKLMKDKWGRPSTKNGKPTLWYGFDATSGKWVDGSCKGLSGKTDQNKCRTKLGLPTKSAPTKPDVEDDNYGGSTTVVPSSDGGMAVF